MATTTMGNRNDTANSNSRVSNQTIYWAIAAIVIIAAIVFYAMRTRTVDTGPATTAAPVSSTTTTTTGTTEMNGTVANPDGSTNSMSNTNTDAPVESTTSGTSTSTTESTTTGTSGR